ncbi:30S ribosomal protein S20 [Salinibacillus xinjiangensis]|uniref:Small ribosomal subunit protein bS20 n=1 Tax=Salinibacillus xinjiangensis TaxID=1229268 RepID=A0A6G1X6R0_9BACI|nr:30S ribosomal protein S20 [Salinibacillus xinjiangensis]MRG86654.1 30S ribosomal protein S20 [Salinibacillus xinjiangensis]
MPNIKSAIKRVRINEDSRNQQQAFKSEMRSSVKRVEDLVEQKNAEQAKDALKDAVSKIDKAVQKGIIHKNNGDRKKSSLYKKVNGLGA